MTDAKPAISDPAPICLFAFNRPDHTARTLRALAASPLAERTVLTAYLDGARTQDEEQQVAETRKVIEAQTGFASVTLNAREENAGLARSIQDGVTATMQAYGKAIVVEDDVVTSPAFLSYMNLALDRYKDEPRVWHIAGYNEDIAENRNLRGAALWRFMSCWGWGSWADRWSNFRRDPAVLIDQFLDEDIRRFNLDGAHDFWSQVLGNERGELKTWAVFWYATIFQNEGLCLSPHFSYAKNIGFDGSGSHGVVNDSYLRESLNLDPEPPFPDIIVEDADALARLKAYYTRRPGLTEKLAREWHRLLRRVSK